MLALVAVLAVVRRSLPSNRVELYDEAIGLLLQRGFGFTDKIGVKDRTTARRALQELAIVLQEADSPVWTVDELDEALWQARKNDDELATRLTSAWSSHADLPLRPRSAPARRRGRHRERFLSRRSRQSAQWLMNRPRMAEYRQT